MKETKTKSKTKTKDKKKTSESWGLQPKDSFVLANRGSVAIYGIVVQ